jgi:hypothetical protein
MKRTQDKKETMKRGKTNIWSNGFKRIIPNDRTIRSLRGCPNKTVNPWMLRPPIGVITPKSSLFKTQSTLPFNTIWESLRSNSIIPERNERVVDHMLIKYTEIETTKIQMNHALAQPDSENNVK